MNKLNIYRECHHKCELCGETEDLLVHHIDHNRSNNEFYNFMVLCTSCHAIHHKRIANIPKFRHLYRDDSRQLTFKF